MSSRQSADGPARGVAGLRLWLSCAAACWSARVAGPVCPVRGPGGGWPWGFGDGQRAGLLVSASGSGSWAVAGELTVDRRGAAAAARRCDDVWVVSCWDAGAAGWPGSRRAGGDGHAGRGAAASHVVVAVGWCGCARAGCTGGQLLLAGLPGSGAAVSWLEGCRAVRAGGWADRLPSHTVRICGSSWRAPSSSSAAR
jgi:hypothetical protein